jgi:hypothetical protein
MFAKKWARLSTVIEGATHCPVCLDGLSLFPRRRCHSIATCSNRPLIATWFSGECGRIPGHHKLLPPQLDPSGRSFTPSRVANTLRSAAGPVLRVHPPPHAVVVALDATYSPRACRGMLLDSYGGFRPPQSRVSLPYVLSDPRQIHPPTDLTPTSPAPHTHSLPMASSVLLRITSSLSPPT